MDRKEAALWEDYWADRTSQQARDAIFSFYAPWIRLRVQHLLREQKCDISLDTAMSSVALRVVRASIPGFCPSRRCGFRTYIWGHIHGAIMDEIRSMGDSSRSQAALRDSIDEARCQLAHKLGYRPNDADVAEATGIDEMVLVRLEEGDVHRSESALGGLEDNGCDIEVLESFDHLTRNMNVESRRITAWYYRDGYNLDDIADKMGITPSAVSYKLKKIRHFLKKIQL